MIHNAPLNLEDSAHFLCGEASGSEGITLSTRVLVEALTPGLRHFNAYFKEGLRSARNGRASELVKLLKERTEFVPLLGIICRDLKSAQSQEWWKRVVEVAECGAQREVITKLIYKQIASSAEAQEYRRIWREEFIRGGGADYLVRALSKGRSEAECVIIGQVTQAALQLRANPKLSADKQIEWMILQRKLHEAMLSQNWGEAQSCLRELVKCDPQDPSVSLYWSLLKCAEGNVEESIKGIKRAAVVAPQDQVLEQLAAESELWRASLAEENEGQDHKAPETELGQPTDYASPKPQLPVKALAHQSWDLPAGLLQAIADLGAERTLDLSVTGLMSQLYFLASAQRRQLREAFTLYPEARGLKQIEAQLKQSLALIERGLGLFNIDPNGDYPSPTFGGSTGIATLSPDQLRELRSLGGQPKREQRQSLLDTPPPIPHSGDEVAPTALVNLINPVNDDPFSSASASLSIDGDVMLDFTLEPVETDLAKAESLMRRGEFAQAEHCLLSLLDQNPFDAYVHNDLGVLYFQTQRFGDAKAHLILAIECTPQYEEAWSNLVELFASLGQLHHALPLFRRYETLIESSMSLKQLRALCAQFAPENLDSLEPPQYEDTIGLRLPLSGSFFLAPSEDEDPSEALSTLLPDEWDPEEAERIQEAKKSAQRELADQKRAEINTLLDRYAKKEADPVKAKTGIFHWIKTQIGLASPPLGEAQQESKQIASPSSGMSEVDPPISTAHFLPEDIHRVRNIAFSMLCVPSGSFSMGTNINTPYGCANEMPQHIVVMSRAFQMARVPVTQELYQAVMFRNPSPNKAPGHPVVRVNWLDAIRFCNTLSELEGLPLVYTIAKGPRPEVAIDPNAAGYRLPYEAEWEYCARAQKEYKYSGSDEIHRVGWAQTDKTKTVARKDPNHWGFYDFSGNVWEWCNDSLRIYSSESQIDPHGEAYPYMHTPSARAIRGGSWCFEEDGSRVAFRGRAALGLRITSLGFRIARSL